MEQEQVTLALQIVNLLWSARGLVQGALKPLRIAGLSRYATPKALRNAIGRHEVTVGNTIRIEGYLSRYAHLFQPLSYSNAQIDIQRAASLANFGRPKPAPGGAMQVTSAMAWRATQNPISSLPAFDVEGCPVRCMFLYPNSHDSFIYHDPIDKTDELKSIQLGNIRRQRVAIPEHGWPLPLLVPDALVPTVSERRVELVTVVRRLPDLLASRLTRLFSLHYQPDVLSLFLIPDMEPPLNYCLSLLEADQDTGVRRVRDSEPAVARAYVYAEGHLEGTGFDGHTITDAIPKAIVPGAANRVERANLVSIAAPGDLAVQILAPGTVGFYAETTPGRTLQETAKALEALVGQFKAGLPKSASFPMDFLFDPDRQHDFDTAGSLSSEHLDKAIRDADLEEARRWLRGEAR